ncbi:TPA: hypothetical protein QDZ28_000640 [Pseudomonas putida]|nr:hypothetical protein [Pseudomonas putida]
MELHLSPTSQAIALVNQLKTELEALFAVLQASRDQVEVHAVYAMEFRHENAVNAADPIEVRHLEGDDAVVAAFEALTCITLKEGQSPKETLRVPGAIALPKVAINQIAKTNALRSELSRVISTIKKTNDRRLVWRKFQDICPKQAMRSTHVLSAPRSINFYWDDTGSSETRHTVSGLLEEWEELLNQNHERRPTFESSPHGSVERALLVSIDLVNQKLLSDGEVLFRDEHVAIRRPVQPHIRARVRDGNSKIKPIICPVPFVYEIGCPPPRIKPLPSYEPHAAGKKSSAVKPGRALLESAPLIESINLYRYHPRVRGPLKAKTDLPSTHADTNE